MGFGANGDRFVQRQHAAHMVGQCQQIFNFPGNKLIISALLQPCDVKPQKRTGDNLRIKGFGGCHGHFNITPAAGVHDTVNFKRDVRVPTIHDSQGMRATLFDHIHGAVGIGGGSRLTDGDHQGVGHAGGIIFFIELKSAEFRCF